MVTMTNVQSTNPLALWTGMMIWLITLKTTLTSMTVPVTWFTLTVHTVKTWLLVTTIKVLSTPGTTKSPNTATVIQFSLKPLVTSLNWSGSLLRRLAVVVSSVVVPLVSTLSATTTQLVTLLEISLRTFSQPCNGVFKIL